MTYFIRKLRIIGLLGLPLTLGNVYAAEDSTIAIVAGRPVHQAELFREMGNLRWLLMDPIPAGESLKQYWLSEREGESRIHRLYERAMHALVEQKVREQLLANSGLWNYPDYSALKQHVSQVNHERAIKKQNHMIYGPHQYAEQTFLEYQTNTALIKLKELLVADGTITITDDGLQAQYDKMKQGPYKQDKFIFDTYKRQVTAAYVEQAFEDWFKSRVANAVIEDRHTPDAETLFELLHKASADEGTKTFSPVANGNIYYIDSFIGDDGNTGLTPDRAWKTLGKVNATVFKPGDRIRFHRGGVWFGKLSPQGDGKANQPIFIDAYGSGPKPLLHGGGLVGSGVVSLYNQSGWTIGDLEIVNPAEKEGDRRGVEIKAENAGTIAHIHLYNLHIHNIRGIRGHDYTSKKTAGIYFAVVDDQQRPTRFDNISITGCLLHHISNQGIVTNNERNHKDYPGTAKWHEQKFTNVQIQQNVVHHIAKNAMIIRLAEQGLIEHNLCYETALGMSGNTMFTISSLGTTFQYNEGFLNRSTDADGSLYDPDLSSPGTIWQYSYSHNNAHGLVWFCTRHPDTGIVVRHNISSNDHGYLVYANYPFSGAKVYGNTFYIGENRSPVIIRENPNNAHVYEFSGNRIYSFSKTAGYELAEDHDKKQDRTIKDNQYYGVAPPSVEEHPTRLNHIPILEPAPPSGYYDVAKWFHSLIY